jgi:hypothetical protein
MGADKNSSQKNSTYITITTLRVTHEQAKAHTNLSSDLRNKASKARKQSRSKHERRQTKTRLPDHYRIIRNQPPDHPGANRTVIGHPALTSKSPYCQQCYTGSPDPYLRIIRDSPEKSPLNSPNFRSMDLPNHLES